MARRTRQAGPGAAAREVGGEGRALRHSQGWMEEEQGRQRPEDERQPAVLQEEAAPDRQRRIATFPRASQGAPYPGGGVQRAASDSYNRVEWDEKS